MVGQGVLAPLTMTQDGPGRTEKVIAGPPLDRQPLKSRILPFLPKDAAPGPEAALRANRSGMERQGLWEMRRDRVGRVRVQGQEAHPCASRPGATWTDWERTGALTSRTGLTGVRHSRPGRIRPQGTGVEHQLCRPRAQ